MGVRQNLDHMIFFVGKCFSKPKNQGYFFSEKPYFFSKNLSNLVQPRNHNLIYLVNKRVSFAQEYDQFLTCPDPSGKFYKANYKVDKVGLWGLLPDY